MGVANLNRRGFLTGLGATLLATSALVPFANGAPSVISFRLAARDRLAEWFGHQMDALMIKALTGEYPPWYTPIVRRRPTPLEIAWGASERTSMGYHGP